MKYIVFLIIAITISYGLGQWLKGKSAETSNTESIGLRKTINYSSCDPTKKACKFSASKIIYQLRFESVPSALVPFVVSVNAADAQPENIELSFDMDGMDMGYNSHRLARDKSQWQAKVILPVCSLGRSDWLLDVKIKTGNEISITKFKFSHVN